MIVTARITNLRARTVIGVYEWEKKINQDILINAAIDYDASKAVETDNINDTMDYCELANEIVEEVEKTKFELLESLVNLVLDIIMKRDNVICAEVRMDKEAALRNIAESVSVTGYREQK